ncbi:hypothetical protein Verru16b_03072 [Lacunisphaera limnophila]|uniref:DUF899 domain-containing protein n=1 Tax=Lacunisphaera limnophila TaxID=1838286 RepID=A0A1D8AYP8_9BACT|nr:DUF899 domain-containing protein [Lacunisphaera limnophila]AOS45981.1 hypothetical protein Verru16b_03072 [Lacunisphaera limnophila]
MTTPAITYPRVASRADWLTARLALLAQEKELTRARDRVNTARRELPMVRITEPYAFASADGPKTLLELFAGRQQLIVYHFMWLWENGRPLDEPCRGCAGFADQIARGHLTTLHRSHTTFALVSRGPLAKLMAFRLRMGWNLPWFSSEGTRFNHDFGVTLDPAVAPPLYNYRTAAEHLAAGSGGFFEEPDYPFDLHGLSCFLRRGDEVYHTYSTYARGVEDVIGPLRLLDQTALGRQEEWEEPKNRAPGLVKPLGPPPGFPDE